MTHEDMQNLSEGEILVSPSGIEYSVCSDCGRVLLAQTRTNKRGLSYGKGIYPAYDRGFDPTGWVSRGLDWQPAEW